MLNFGKYLNPGKYTGGHFADNSGGLISFAATNFKEAEEIMVNDPFISEELFENKWLKEWIPEN